MDAVSCAIPLRHTHTCVWMPCLEYYHSDTRTHVYGCRVLSITTPVLSLVCRRLSVLGPRYATNSRIYPRTDDLARLRRAPGGGGGDEVDGMDYFGLRVCVYNAGERRLQYGMVDDAEDRSVHVMYDDEAEGWVNLPSKQVRGVSPGTTADALSLRKFEWHARRPSNGQRCNTAGYEKVTYPDV
jgi:hypothetical protein